MSQDDGILREPRSDAGAADTGARPFGTDRHGPGKGRGGDGGDGGRERSMVPRAEFRSYYGRPVLKPPVWDWKIAGYLFTGGLSASAALLAAGADLTGRPALRRGCRLGSSAGLLASMYLLVADLGRPERFHHMLRVAKPSSPMSIGTWILVAYGPGTVLASAAELLPASVRATLPGRLVRLAARPAGLASAVVAPAVASYTAVLLSQTAVPAWHEAHRHLPFLFTGSAAAAGGGFGMVVAPVAEAGPARRLAAAGAAAELVTSRLIDRRPGLVTEAFTTGRAHRLRRASECLTLGGAAVAATLARRSRTAAAAAGLALLAGSVLQRFGTFEAGVASTRDPAYVVVPQRERLRRAAAGGESPV
ncbi:polysulfide reductase [Streptomyces ruber]|uniref:Polysulfide reductase n=2 Tax=Streptomyces TaxID=1883 RepID=A0A918BB17_9ACTN|nr:NrfD/PsrC family molybdoenzyme membrane anchor subunit [Streptomyces ruber]GGQ51704.1 polysulfide reductase [Streptomyces ruber]